MAPLMAIVGRSFGLKLARSNNKPEFPATFYLECVKETRGCPLLIRTDCGTENGIMASMQCFFRQNGNDLFAGEKAHKYGSSPANQRIEVWWSSLKCGGLSFGEDELAGGLTSSKTW